MFVDTAGWATLLIAEERYHEFAVNLVKDHLRTGGHVVTTNYVITELISLFTSPYRLSRPRQIKLIETILSAPWVEVVHIDPPLNTRSLDLLRARADKLWSLVDCAAFIVMKDQGIRASLITDHHFEQAGFERLLK